MSSPDDFFEEQTEQSAVKAQIVSEYFKEWARVIQGYQGNNSSQTIAYLDLYAGTGRYKDGQPSTPLLILEHAISTPLIRDNLITVFNEGNPENEGILRQHIAALPGVASLRHAPIVTNHQIGIRPAGVKTAAVPTLSFIDPFGYKGLTLDLIQSLLQGWGCECIVYFNYNRINRDLTNEVVRKHLDALFGPERAKSLRATLRTSNPGQREKLVVEEFQSALKSIGAKFILPFRFKRSDGSRTMYYLYFATKVFKGFEIMKTTMAPMSSVTYQGVPSFELNPREAAQGRLLELLQPLNDLEEMLLKDFAGQTLTFRQIYERHSGDKPFGERNYKDVLLQLEARGEILVYPPVASRPKRLGAPTFGDNVRVTFPRRTN